MANYLLALTALSACADIDAPDSIAVFDATDTGDEPCHGLDLPPDDYDGHDPLQHAPCDPAGGASECGSGHCAVQAAPSMTWGCEMYDKAGPAGSACDRHGQCASGVCLLASTAPGHPSGYGACARLCSSSDHCQADAFCARLSDEQTLVCVEP